MMTPDPTRDDISFLKRVSEEGRYAPLLGGRYLLMWGGVIAVGYIFQYLILARHLAWPGWSLGMMWLVLMGIAFGFMRAFPRSLAHKPGQSAISNQVERWVWTGVGMAIGCFALGTFIAAGFTGAPVILFDMIGAVAFGGYGAAFLVVSKIAGQPWMRRPAIAAFIGTAATPFLAGTPEVYLMGTVVIIFCAIIPGIVMLRAEPAALPEAA